MKKSLYLILIIVLTNLACNDEQGDKNENLGKLQVVNSEPICCEKFTTLKTEIDQLKNENLIEFKKSNYGLIFTTIYVNEVEVNAMIDFGDPHVMQLSSTFVKENNLNVEPTGDKGGDIFGNVFDINTGIAREVKIGKKNINDVEFMSMPGEMESVSKQINTVFNAVIGWGYFKQYYVFLDYTKERFQLYKTKPNLKKELFRTTYDKQSNYLKIQVEINDKKVNLIVDTGAPSSTIDSNFFNKNKLDNGSIYIKNNRIPIDFRLMNLPMLNANRIGILGGDFLSQFKIFIDTTKNEILFFENE